MKLTINRFVGLVELLLRATGRSLGLKFLTLKNGSAVLHLPQMLRQNPFRKGSENTKKTIAVKTDNPAAQRSAMLNVALNNSKPTSDNACH